MTFVWIRPLTLGGGSDEYTTDTDLSHYGTDAKHRVAVVGLALLALGY
mgnify:CR=1 FL=1